MTWVAVVVKCFHSLECTGKGPSGLQEDRVLQQANTV